jgi:hypothetical protein
MRIPEDVDAIKDPVKDDDGDCPSLLRCRAIRWWAQIAVLGVFLAGAAVSAAVFLGPLLIEKVRNPLVRPPLSGFVTDDARSPSIYLSSAHSCSWRDLGSILSIIMCCSLLLILDFSPSLFLISFLCDLYLTT